VRIPAALNGLFGLKPTRGGIPNPHAPNDRFGMSAPGNTVFKELGITAEAVVAAAKKAA
jgi:Asp-tRNA(Asn)/Glu-tRNA(Gln) amidotransferase A subunit family amidase